MENKIKDLEWRVKDLEHQNEYFMEKIQNLEHELNRVYHRFIHLYTYLYEKDAEINYPEDGEVDSWIIEEEGD